jgi:cephalosporin-C deacetylase-like acetyl esterase
MVDQPTIVEGILTLGLDLGTAFGSPMLPDYIRKRVSELMRMREKEAANIITKAQWTEHRDNIRRLLLKSFGLYPMPDRTPLNAKDIGTINQDGFRIKKVLFEPRPECIATAHIYLPMKFSKPLPAILFAVGHWIENGKMEPDLQKACIGLVKQGFVVLIYDPLEQGERRLNWRCHNHLEAHLVGLSQAGLLVWESIRAIDLLQSLQEVDPQRIGMTGASGGGHNTMYVSAIDERIRASVPVCYVNAFENLLGAMRGYNWVGGQDLCNQVPHVLSYADMGDICALIAPRPLRIINATHDPMFPTEGACRAKDRAKALYKLLGVSDRIDLTLIESGHGYFQEMREAAYGWFKKWLLDEGDGSPIPETPIVESRPRYEIHYITATANPNQPKPIAEPDMSPELFCFPSDQPQSSWTAITKEVRRVATGLPLVRTSVTSLADWSDEREKLSKSLCKVLGPLPEQRAYTPNIVNQFRFGKVHVECIRYESEPGIVISAMLYLTENWQDFQPVVIYVNDLGKRMSLFDGTVQNLHDAGYAVFTLDLRGTGEMASTEFENASDSFMLDRDLFSQRLWDLLRGVDYLESYSVIGCQLDKHHISCLGQGIAGLLALYAGAIDQRITAVGCLNAPVSYKEMIAEIALYPASAYVFDVLNHFDIEHVAAMVAPRPLYIGNPLDRNTKSVTQQNADQSYAWCRQIYQTLGADDLFHLNTQESDQIVKSYAEWLNRRTR